MFHHVARRLIITLLTAAHGLTLASGLCSQESESPPVLTWKFEGGEFDGVGKAAVISAVRGKPTLEVSGPRPPEFPHFDERNSALRLDGNSWLELVDPPDGSCRFAEGDTISIETWVRVSELKNGSQVYVIGKGRLGSKGKPRDNQSWALRLRGVDGSARISFLFRSLDEESDAAEAGSRAGEFHRWNSDLGFVPDGEWHHIAVSFQFCGEAQPIGWVDGSVTGGTWDMGAAGFQRRPVVDDDAIWIGSSMGGNASGTFRGELDNIAVYRRELRPDEIADRWVTTRPAGFLPELADSDVPVDTVTVEIRERVQVAQPWAREGTQITQRWQQPVAALHRLPRHYIKGGLAGDRTNPSTLRLRTIVETPEWNGRVLIRSRSQARLLVDGVVTAQLGMMSSAASGHQEVPEPPAPHYPQMHPVASGCQEAVVPLLLAAGQHMFELETLVGGRNMRLEIGDTLIALSDDGSRFYLPGHTDRHWSLDESDWQEFLGVQEQFLREHEAETRRSVSVAESEYWAQRHRRIQEWIGFAASELSSKDIDDMLLEGLQSRGLTPLPKTDELAFLRRLTLNTVGVIPSAEEIAWYLNLPAANRRSAAVSRFLEDPRWADHWVSYWQDVLAENPGILKPELNNSGPFRWWIYEVFRDNRSTDRFATELVMMRGSQLGGGPAGFSLATQNDVPMAERAIVLSAAFQAQNLACARCHDSPVNGVSQESLFAMASMLNRGALRVPETSSVPRGPDGQRHAAVTVSLEPGSVVEPSWAFAEKSDSGEAWDELLRTPSDTREQLALYLTHPQHSRFAEVIVNRLWHRLFGRGLVASIDDWFEGESQHAELLAALARHHMASGYNLKATAELIMNSHAWQRQAAPSESPVAQHFGAVTLQRMTAEQIVDSLYVAVGKQFDAEKLTLDPEGRRPASTFLNLGAPARAWELCSLSNERDRPALALPVSQSLVDLLSVFGWRESRTHTQTVRETPATVLQPLTMANGNAGHRIVQFSDNSSLTDVALESESPEELLREFFLRTLTRPPHQDESRQFLEELSPGFGNRRIAGASRGLMRGRQNVVSWSNHLNAEATRIKQEQESAARLGDPPTERLEAEWRLTAEDLVWVLLNSPEFCFIP